MPDSSPAKVSDAPKRCCRCGKDLTGRKRYKNREGYWCRSCNATDELNKKRLGQGKRRVKGPVIALVSLGVLAVLVVVYLLWIQ